MMCEGSGPFVPSTTVIMIKMDKYFSPLMETHGQTDLHAVKPTLVEKNILVGVETLIRSTKDVYKINTAPFGAHLKHAF